jgi:hypothetical protein
LNEAARELLAIAKNGSLSELEQARAALLRARRGLQATSETAVRRTAAASPQLTKLDINSRGELHRVPADAPQASPA